MISLKFRVSNDLGQGARTEHEVELVVSEETATEKGEEAARIIAAFSAAFDATYQELD